MKPVPVAVKETLVRLGCPVIPHQPTSYARPLPRKVPSKGSLEISSSISQEQGPLSMIEKSNFLGYRCICIVELFWTSSQFQRPQKDIVSLSRTQKRTGMASVGLMKLDMQHLDRTALKIGRRFRASALTSLPSLEDRWRSKFWR